MKFETVKKGKIRWRGIMKVMLLLLVLFNFSFPTSSATLTNNLDSGNQLEKLRDKQKEESNGSITSGGSGIVSESKFAHAGGNGGRSVGEGSNQNGGHSNASPLGGGGAVIPVYAPGGVGARQRNNSHTAASNSSLCGKDGLLLIVVATILTSLLLHIFE